MVQCCITWLLSCLWLTIAVGASLCLLAGNFLVAWQSFSLQGFENTPLSQTPFLGSWAAGLGVGAAPMSALYAFFLTVAMNVAAIKAMKLVFEFETLLFDWRRVRRASDPVTAGHARDLLINVQHTAVKAVVAIALAVAMLSWDVGLFRFRYEALLSGLTDPMEAIAWAGNPVVRLGTALADLVGRAVWGYAAAILATGFASEVAFERARERWARLGRSIHEALDLDNEPLRPRSLPPSDAADGSQVAAAEDPVNRVEGQEVAPEYAAPHTEPVQPESDVVHKQVAPPPPHADDIPEPRSLNSDPHVDVIVGSGQAREVPVREVEANPERFVRGGSGRQWFDREYYEREILAQSVTDEEIHAHA
jgi:hypothetical protein